LAACIGNTFDLHTLFAIYERSIPETAAALLKHTHSDLERSGILATRSRQYATLGRMEEFILILPNTDRNGVAHVAEQVRHAVEVLTIEHTHSLVGAVVTVSAGSATMVPGVMGGTEQLLREADIALYRAKRMGRNQVHSAPEVSSPPMESC
jgi:diguanylate cyclase (GGDEF)-like protein